eukprot:3283270-Prymnesium_polylepis.1
MVGALQDFVQEEVLLRHEELRHILGGAYTEPGGDDARVTDDASVKVLSGMMPGALFERLGLVPKGGCWGMTARDFDEGGRIEHLLSGAVWLGPKQRVILQAEAAGEGRRGAALRPKQLVDHLRKS